MRLGLAVLIATLGGVGMWSVPVSLPAVQAEFGIARAAASLPFTLTMVGFAFGGIALGRLADWRGVALPLMIGAIALACGYVAAGLAPSLPAFALAQGALIGFGSAASFGPLIADISLWFSRRRGIAVAIASSGSYLAGTIWPLSIQGLTGSFGWRSTYFGIGVFCLVTMLPLVLALRRRRPTLSAFQTEARRAELRVLPEGLPPLRLQLLLMLAGVFCCMAMAMPQVHIVAYCVDLGYGSANGARMLSLMLGTGIVSRLAFGWVADRIGPLPSLLLSSSLQAASLLLYLASDGLMSLYAVTALFGLVQGGIVVTYTLIIREYFPPAEAGTRVGLVLSATLAGMAIGGWMSGAIFDATLSYRAAFLNGFVWNLLNMAIAAWLLWRLPRRRRHAFA